MSAAARDRRPARQAAAKPRGRKGAGAARRPRAGRAARRAAAGGEIRASERLLLRLGDMMGFCTYSANASAMHEGRRLGEDAEYGDLEGELGLRSPEAASRVDVVWLSSDEPEHGDWDVARPKYLAFFEVVPASGVAGALQRLHNTGESGSPLVVVSGAAGRAAFSRLARDGRYGRRGRSFRFATHDMLEGMSEAASAFYASRDRILGKGFAGLSCW